MAKFGIDPRVLLNAVRATARRGPRITGDVARQAAAPVMRTAGGIPITSSAARSAAQRASSPSAGAVLGGLGTLGGLGAGAAALFGAMSPTSPPPAATSGGTADPSTGQGGSGQGGSGQGAEWENRYPPDQTSTTAEQKLLELLLEQAKTLSDPAYYAQRRAIDLDIYKAQSQLARDFGMEQTRELTRRKIEGDTIAAWRGITEAQIDANAKIGLGMMNLAYAAGVPNPNILTGGAALAGQGRATFGTPSSTIS